MGELSNHLLELLPSNDKAVASFAANVILLLDGARRSFIIEEDTPRELISEIINSNDDVRVLSNESSKIMIMKDNIQWFVGIMEEEPLLIRALDIVLGHPYHHEMEDKNSPGLTLSFRTKEFVIFTTVVPRNKFTDEVMLRAREIVTRFNRSLKQHGYETHARCDY